MHDLRPSKPPEGELDGGQGHEGGQGFGKVLEIVGETPVASELPNQEKVRSITQRCGSTTKPFLSSLRLTIAMRSDSAFATAASTCQAL